VQSISASLEGSVPKNTATWQAGLEDKIMTTRHADASVNAIGIDCENRIKPTNEGLTIPLI